MPIEPLNLEVLHETTRELPAHEIPANHQWTATERQDGVWERKDTVSRLLCTVMFYADLAHSLTRSP